MHKLRAAVALAVGVGLFTPAVALADTGANTSTTPVGTISDAISNLIGTQASNTALGGGSTGLLSTGQAASQIAQDVAAMSAPIPTTVPEATSGTNVPVNASGTTVGTPIAQANSGALGSTASAPGVVDTTSPLQNLALGSTAGGAVTSGTNAASSALNTSANTDTTITQNGGLTVTTTTSAKAGPLLAQAKASIQTGSSVCGTAATSTPLGSNAAAVSGTCGTIAAPVVQPIPPAPVTPPQPVVVQSYQPKSSNVPGATSPVTGLPFLGLDIGGALLVLAGGAMMVYRRTIR